MVSFCCEIFFALLRRYGANLLHCRSPFYLCFEHVDNLGAYTASRPETGLLIPSDYNNYAGDSAQNSRLEGGQAEAKQDLKLPALGVGLSIVIA